MKTQRNHEEKARQWRGHVEAQKVSGLSVRQYCRDHGLSKAQYYYWLRRFNDCDEAPCSVPSVRYAAPPRSCSCEAKPGAS